MKKEKETYKKINCKHCHDTVDSFGKYVSTYCSKKQINVCGFGRNGEACEDCEFHTRRDEQ